MCFKAKSIFQVLPGLCFFPLLAWFLPIASFKAWGAVCIFTAVAAFQSMTRPRLSKSLAVFCLFAAAALLLRGVDALMDFAWQLPPVGFGFETANHSKVTVYVATRDMPEYGDALSSIRASFGAGDKPSSLVDLSGQMGRLASLTDLLGDIQASFSAHAGLPKLDLVLLDVGSVVPVEETSIGMARIERIDAAGDSRIPVFHAWEHIARTATSERVMFFDEDVLIPQAFDWALYLQGDWFFKKQFRDYTACWSAQRTSVVKMVSRLRATPHLYTGSVRWGGQEDKLAIFAMGLRQAPDVLAYHKRKSTAAFQQALDQAQGGDSTRIFDRYLLEWNREGDPPAGFTSTISGPLSDPFFRIILRGYGLWAILDLLLLSEMHLLPPHGFVKNCFISLHASFQICEDSLPASLAFMRDWRQQWVSDNMLLNIIVDGGSKAVVFVLCMSVCAVLVWLHDRALVGKAKPTEGDPLLARKHTEIRYAEV